MCGLLGCVALILASLKLSGQVMNDDAISEGALSKIDWHRSGFSSCDNRSRATKLVIIDRTSVWRSTGHATCSVIRSALCYLGSIIKSSQVRRMQSHICSIETKYSRHNKAITTRHFLQSTWSSYGTFRSHSIYVDPPSVPTDLSNGLPTRSFSSLFSLLTS